MRLFPSTIATADRNLCAVTKLALDYIILGTEIDAPSDKRSGSEERTLSPFPASLVSGEHPYVLNFSSPSNLLVGTVVIEARAATNQGQR